MLMQSVNIQAGQWTAIGTGMELIGFHVDTSTPVRMHVSDNSNTPALDAPYLPVQSYLPNVSVTGTQFKFAAADFVFLMAIGSDAKVTLLISEGARNTGAAELIELGKKQGRVYSVSSGNATIANGQRLKFELNNPTGSGVRLWVFRQTFTNNRQGADEMLVRSGRPSDTPLVTSGVEVTRIRLNDIPGAPRASLATCFMLADNSPPVTNLAIGENLPLNGQRVVNEVLFVLYPGRSFVYEIEGASGALVDPAKASVSLQYFEEDYTVA